MSAVADGIPAKAIAWWREPTKDQWFAWTAGWLGWMLDNFDYTMFLLLMIPIAREFNVSLTNVAFIISATLWLRLIGAVISGWFADRIGRRGPLMVSIMAYSLCSFAAGFSPNFTVLLLLRALLGLGMGGEWPAGAALALESWPPRSRGLMSGMLQGSSCLGFLLASLAYALLFESIGWRGLLMIGILPAFVVLFVRLFVKESSVWLENKELQTRQTNEQISAPLFSIFKRGLLANTLTSCWWMISMFIIYISITALFATHLQKDLNLSPTLVATPLVLANGIAFVAFGFWGMLSDRLGRRWSMIIPTLIAIVITPIYLLSSDLTVIVVGFTMQGLFGLSLYGQNPVYLAERFPTEVRATASAFVYHFGSFIAGFTPPILTWIASEYSVGLNISMLIGTIFGAVNVVVSLLLGPETKGKILGARSELG